MMNVIYLLFQPIRCPAGSTTDLRKHAKRKHSIMWQKLLTNEIGVEPISPSAMIKQPAIGTPRATSQLRLQSYTQSRISLASSNISSTSGFEVVLDSDDDNVKLQRMDAEIAKYSSASKKQLNRDRRLAFFLVDTCTPFHRIDHPSFKAFVGKLDPKWNSPSAKRMSASIIPSLRKEIFHRDILPRLAAASCISITTDSWKSITRTKYTTLNVHLVDPDSSSPISLNIQTLPLDTTSETGQDLAKNLRKALEQTLGGLCAKVKFGVADRASNQTKSLRIFGCAVMFCNVHMLNTITKHAVKDCSDIDELLKKTHHISLKIRSDSELNSQLKSQQMSDPKCLRVLELIPHMDVRFMTFYITLRRFIKLKPYLRSILPLTGMPELQFNVNEWLLAEEVLNVLEPLNEAIVRLSGSEYATLPMVFPTIHQLRIKLSQRKEALELDSSSRIEEQDKIKMVSFFDAIDRELNSFWDYRTLTTLRGEPATSCRLKYQMAASLLHPLFKDVDVIDDATTTRCWAYLKELGTEIIKHHDSLFSKSARDDIDQHSSNFHTRVASTKDTQIFLTKRKKAVEAESSLSSFLRMYQLDLTRYASQPVETPFGDQARDNDFFNFNISSWWHTNKAMFPSLYIVYQAIASCPASSIPAEEIFSIGGLTITKHRTALKEQMASTLMFLTSNRRATQRHTENIDALCSVAKDDEDGLAAHEGDYFTNSSDLTCKSENYHDSDDSETDEGD